MNYLRHLIPVLCVALGTSCALWTKKPAHQPLAFVLPPLPPALPTRKLGAVIKPQRSYHLYFQWDANPAAVGYRIYTATQGQSYAASTALFATNWGAVSNLWPGVAYQFAITDMGIEGIESDYSVPAYWPRARTNFIALGVSQAPAGAFTTNSLIADPPSSAFYRLQRVSRGYELQISPDMKYWILMENWPATNQTGGFWLRQAVFDNWSTFEHPDR